VHLTKHHAQGNDFLVLVDLENDQQVEPEVAVGLCDRRRGIGADGFIRAVGRDSAAVPPAYQIACAMELTNADGSSAEISGNGIRCLAHCLWASGAVEGDSALIATAAGVRKVSLESMPEPHRASVSVAMGPVKVFEVDDLSWLPPTVGRSVRAALRAEVGNPHLVIMVEPGSCGDLEAAGRAAQEAFEGGINLELVSLSTPGRLDMAVYERGAGATLACGSGSCAAAAAARHWGVAGESMVVANPGGDVTVSFCDDEAVLSGEVVQVASMDVSEAWLREL
jgi:diaminopimelate epimerase